MNQRPSFGWMGRIGLGLTLAACSAAGPVAPSPTPSVTSTASPAPTVTTAPTASPVATLASSSSPAVLARGTFQNKGATVELDATGSGSSVHGHMTMSASDYSLTVELECARTFDAFLLIGGDVTQSTLGSVPVGTRVAMVIKRGSPLQAHPDFENPDPPEATCMAYLEEIDEARASDQLDPISDIELGP